MDFGLSEEQQMLQETVRSFVENECPVPHLREVFDSESYTYGFQDWLIDAQTLLPVIRESYGSVYRDRHEYFYHRMNEPGGHGQICRSISLEVVSESIQLVTNYLSNRSGRGQ